MLFLFALALPAVPPLVLTSSLFTLRFFVFFSPQYFLSFQALSVLPPPPLSAPRRRTTASLSHWAFRHPRKMQMQQWGKRGTASARKSHTSLPSTHIPPLALLRKSPLIPAPPKRQSATCQCDCWLSLFCLRVSFVGSAFPTTRQWLRNVPALRCLWSLLPLLASFVRSCSIRKQKWRSARAPPREPPPLCRSRSLRRVPFVSQF